MTTKGSVEDGSKLPLLPLLEAKTMLLHGRRTVATEVAKITAQAVTVVPAPYRTITDRGHNPTREMAMDRCDPCLPIRYGYTNCERRWVRIACKEVFDLISVPAFRYPLEQKNS